MRRFLSATILVSSLGYFVDIYDLILFSIVRIQSLKAIGIPESELMDKGTFLLNMQMAGMLVGGVIWGIMGDRKGRVSVLYGSILLYSVANIANAFVTSFETYAALRLIAGIGLAGELGAAVTLVAEMMPIKDRGYGVAIVASIGILGALFAAFVSETFSWQMAYIVGGVMGLVLLGLRIKMHDSPIYQSIQSDAAVKKGQFSMFFSDRKRFVKYISCIFIGTPTWFIVGVLVAFAPEITKALNATEPVMVGRGIGWLYLGLSLGDLLSGFMSQWLKSRKIVVALFVLASVPLMMVYLTWTERSSNFYYLLFFILGITNGYWAVMVTIGAEQFGTNLRATAATTVPNFVRAMVIPLTLSVKALKTHYGLIPAVSGVAVVSVILAFAALWFLEETYHRELDYLELDAGSPLP